VGAQPPGSPSIASLGHTGVRERLGQLLDEQPGTPSHPTAAALNALATAMVVVTLLLAGSLPTAAVAGAGADAHGAHHAHREH
jgi:hypothetical protein